MQVAVRSELLHQYDRHLQPVAVLGDPQVLGPHAHSDLRTRPGRHRFAEPLEVHPAVGHRRLEEVHRRRADETGDERVDRVVVQLARGVDLLEYAVLEHRDTVAHRHGLDLVVGHVDHRGAQIPLQLGDLCTRRHTELGVEVRQRFVHEEDLRIAHDRPAHRHTLPLATGELLGLAVQVRHQVEHLCGGLHPLGDLLLARLGQLEREAHVLADRVVRVQRVVLEHHRDVPVLGFGPGDVPVADEDASGGHVLEAGERAQGGRLAATGGPDQDEELAVGDLQVQAVHAAPRGPGIDD